MKRLTAIVVQSEESRFTPLQKTSNIKNYTTIFILDVLNAYHTQYLLRRCPYILLWQNNVQEYVF